MNDIRITSGKLKGRSIKSPNSKLTHPMGAREKLALFNMISEYLPEATVLDAYAGSGALGIEALSRGAKYVVFIEKAPNVAKIISDNLEDLDLSRSAEIHRTDAEKFSSNEKFDVVIIDPPYDKFEILGAENLVKYLKSTGVLVLSHPGEAPEIRGLKLDKTRSYAGAKISIYTIPGKFDLSA